MGLGESIRSLDFVSALRGWREAEARYRARGLPVVEKAPFDDPETFLTPDEWEASPSFRAKRRARELAEAARSAFERGEDAEAFRHLDLAWAEGEDDTILAALHDVGNRKIALHRIESALPALAGNASRLRSLLVWLEAAPPVGLARRLRGESAAMAATPTRRNWYLKANQSRAMDAWARIDDETDGFSAPPETIARILERVGDESGMSRMMLQIMLPILAQGVEGVGRFADRMGAVKGLVGAMVVHAETGVWPEAAEPTVRVVCGEGSASLRLPPG